MDDRDPVNYNYKFGKQTVLLHPKNRCHEDAKIDIVLVHGLLGGVSFSWREKDLHINEPLSLFGEYLIIYNFAEKCNYLLFFRSVIIKF